MTANHYFKNIIIKIYRDNNNIYFMVILIIATILLISSLTFKNNMNDYIEEFINKNIGFRTLSASPKSEIESVSENELLNIEHIVDAYNSVYNYVLVDSEFKNEELNGKIKIKYLEKSAILYTLKGQYFKENDRKVAIIPKEFYPDSSVYNFELNEGNVIDGESLIGQDITITYYTRKIEGFNVVNDEKKTEIFTIVGVYDNKENMNFNNEIYVPLDDIKEIVENKIPQNDNSDISTFQISDYSINIVIDKLENVRYVMNRLDEMGFENIETTMEMDEEMVNTIKFSCYILSAMSILVIIFIMILYIKKKIIRESNFIGILRTCGYTKSDVKIQYVIEILVTGIITYATGCILSIIIYMILKNTIFSSFIYIGYNIRLYLVDFAITFIGIVFLSIMISLNMICKKVENNIINLVESRE